MKAILLAAGYATRLYPLTLDTPKALLQVAGKPMLDHILAQADKLDDINEYILVSNHKFIGQFEEWAKTAPTAKKLTVLDDGTSNENDRLGAIGDIQFAIEKCEIDEDDIIVLCSDNLFTFDLLDYYRFFREKNCDCVCVKQVTDYEEIKGYAVALLDAESRITELEEKPQNPKSDIAVFATYFYTKDTVRLFERYLAEGNKPDAPGYFPQWLYSRKPVFAYKMNGECYDIGTHKAYEEIQQIFG